MNITMMCNSKSFIGQRIYEFILFYYTYIMCVCCCDVVCVFATIVSTPPQFN